MEVIFSEDFQKQLKIIRGLAKQGNIDFLALYNRIGLCVKALESVDCIDDIPFELRFHKGNSNQIGHLAQPLDKCLSIDLDSKSRFLTFEQKGNAIVVTSLGHYNIYLSDNLGKEISLFKSSEEVVGYFDQLLDDGLDSLRKESEQAKYLLLNAVDDVELTDTIIHTFDSNLKKSICPLNPGAVKSLIASDLGDWEEHYKLTNNVSKIRFEDSQIRDTEVSKLVDKYTSVLERSIVNARGLSNAGAVVCGNKDPDKTAELKIMLDEGWVKHFSHLVYYVNTKVSSIKIKKELFDKMGKALIRGFDNKYDRIVETDNEKLRSLDKALRDAVVKDIGNILDSGVNIYLKTIKKTNQQTIFDRLFPKFTVTLQNLKSLFSGKTSESDNGVESVSVINEKDESISDNQNNQSQINNYKKENATNSSNEPICGSSYGILQEKSDKYSLEASSRFGCKNCSSENTYFTIPFYETSEAKRLGAKWDRKIKYWYVPSGTDLNPFIEKGWKRLGNEEVTKARSEMDEQRSGLKSKSFSKKKTHQEPSNIKPKKSRGR